MSYSVKSASSSIPSEHRFEARISRWAGVPVGTSVGDDPEILADWVARGVNWLAMGGDLGRMLRSAAEVVDRVRTFTHLHREPS
jgi:hypothetical protein